MSLAQLQPQLVLCCLLQTPSLFTQPKKKQSVVTEFANSDNPCLEFEMQGPSAARAGLGKNDIQTETETMFHLFDIMACLV